MNATQIIAIIVLLCFTACKNDSDENGPLNESVRYSICNNLLADSDCLGGTGAYCLFGYKWGDKNSFESTGYDNSGPRVTGGVVTFSFQESNGLVNTHAQIDLPSRSFDNLVDCAKEEIRRALDAWSNAAAIDFSEENENSDSDIRFFVADIRQSGVGYPNFPENPCNIMGGDVIIRTNVKYDECETFYRFVLHEIGHVLGLGHVNSTNIMNADLAISLDGLQSGDKQGLIEIYGER